MNGLTAWWGRMGVRVGVVTAASIIIAAFITGVFTIWKAEIERPRVNRFQFKSDSTGTVIFDTATGRIYATTGKVGFTVEPDEVHGLRTVSNYDSVGPYGDSFIPDPTPQKNPQENR